MRHRVYGKHLGRDKNERQTLFRGLIYSLFQTGTIQTSEAKAKAIKGLVDKIINLAKGKNSSRQLQSYVSDETLRERLVKDIIPNLGIRTSGYAQLVKLGTRLGDRTMMVKMSLIGAEKLKPIKEELNSHKESDEPKVKEFKKKDKTVLPKK